jgi:regulator of cell morphogenesis and NO signaling
MSDTAEISVGQLVAERPSRARTFEKLGIDYCCGGKNSLREACREKNLNYEAVVLEMDGSDAASTAAERNWSSASVTDLCDHIEHTHHAYLKQELPRLESMTTKVAAKHGESKPALREVREIFKTLKEEMDSHMAKEEHILFPLCRKLDVADTLPKMHCGSIGNPIEVMMQEHADTGDELARIRSLTDNFTCPPDACNTFRAMYDSLQQLERDMHQHVHKENNILFPKALRLEKLLCAEES